MTTTIKTNIKFYKGLGNVENRLYGFVTKVKGSWRGCREDEPKKKIVFVDSAIADNIVPNLLYYCSLHPMQKDGTSGFIAKSARLIKFEARILMKCHKGQYIVKVQFGNKELIYEPGSRERRKRDIQAIADNLRDRLDLENAAEIAEEFISTACMVKQMYTQHQQKNVR